MASKIEQRGQRGTWWYYGYFNGRQYRHSLKTTKKRVAEREQRAYDAKYDRPGLIVPDAKNPTCADFWQLYTEWAERNRRPRTFEIQQLFWNQLMAFSKAERMGHITRETFENMKRRRKKLGKKGWSPQTVNNALKDYQAIWNRGLREGWLTGVNPVEGVERFDITRRKPTFHTQDELEALLAEAEKHGRNLAWAVLLMGWAGLRKNELVNLRWEHLDFNEEAPVVKIRAGHDFTIKTNEERDIPMNRRIFEALEPHREDEGYLFESDRVSEGKHRYRYDPRRALTSALDEAGLATEEPCQRLRRTFGSMLVQRGVSIYKVAQWMGHSVRVCERHYAGLVKYDEDINRF